MQILMNLQIDGVWFQLIRTSYDGEYQIKMFKDGEEYIVFECEDKEKAENTMLVEIKRVMRKDHCFANLQLMYRIKYPTDRIGKEICPDIDTYDVFHYFQDKKIYSYELFFANDSIVRERVFEELSIRFKTPYSYIYEIWRDEAKEVTEDVPFGKEFEYVIDTKTLTLDVKIAA